MKPDDRIDRSLEHRLSPKEWEELQEDLRNDEALRRTYVEERWLHASLLADRNMLASLAETPESGRTRISSRAGWAAAALLSLFGGLLFLFGGPSAPETVATLIEAKNCRWDGSELPTNEGARLGLGLISLAEGMASIRFDSGAVVTLEAPSSLQLVSEMQCRLVEGSVVADVPESAHGFVIHTDKIEVIDLGTRFGVTSTPVGGSHVFVFEGEVKVHEEENMEGTHVLTGSSLHFGTVPPAADGEASRDPLLVNLPSDWIPVSTARGEGKDAFIRRGYGSGGGDSPLLMVKHTDIAPNNERRAVLTFDLGGLEREEFLNARLTLKMESSGLGFSSLVPDSRFAVWGVHDPAIHSWEESSIVWEDAGGFASPELDENQFAKLASFEIRKGAPNGIVEVSSDALAEFLLSRTDSLVTLVVLRETGEHDKQGLVHAFASKEHPTGPAPTLWFQTNPLK